MKKITLLFLLIALPMMASTELIYPWVSANDMFSSKIEEIGESIPEKEDADVTLLEDTHNETET